MRNKDNHPRRRKVWGQDRIICSLLIGIKGLIAIFLFLELQYGEIEEMNVCDNLGDHLVGNVYIKFRYEEDAEKAVKDLDNRWYNGEAYILLCIPIVRFKDSAYYYRSIFLCGL